jgi:hypothetical protein
MTSLRSGVKMVLMKKIKYDLNYIKKNINLNEFIKLLKTKALWHLDSEVNIINYAIISCVFKNNQDTNFFKYEDEEEDIKTLKLNQEILINSFDLEFFEKIEKYEIDGTLLKKINPIFKRIFHYELMGEGVNNNNPNEIDSHTMYSLINSSNKDYFYISKTNEFHQVVSIFDSSGALNLDEEDMNTFFFMSYIICFKETRDFPEPVFDKKYYINSKTGKNVLDEIGYDFFEKRILRKLER